MPTCSFATGSVSRGRSIATRALAELARRYLAGHAPAEDRDLARWAGLPLRDARAGLKAIASELEQRDDGLVDLKRRPAAAGLPAPKLLGSFDPLLLGWTSREPILGTNQGVVTLNGVFRPIALVRGRAVATWAMPAGKVTLEPFGRITRKDAAALEADAADVTELPRRREGRALQRDRPCQSPSDSVVRERPGRRAASSGGAE